MDFKYKCIDQAGRGVDGVMTATGPSEVKSALQARGLTVIEIQAKMQAVKREFFAKKVKDADMYNLFRELCILLKAGVKIDKALEILSGTFSAGALKEHLLLILRSIKSGKALATAFADTGRFSSLIVTMIHAGESVGDIRSAFENIAEYQRFQIQFKSEIKNALAYPAFLICASFITIVVIFKFIIPRFFSIFGQKDTVLPLPAKILYGMGNILGMANIYFFIGAVVLVIFLVKTVDTRGLFSKFYSRLTYIPLVGKLSLYLELSRFSYLMYSMMNSGIEFINALKLSTGIIMDQRIRGAIEPCIAQIKEGKGIADTFSHVSLMPEIVHSMLKVGEESGNLKDIFLEIHNVFDERFKNITKRVLSLIEPLVITVTGAIVGFIVISLILTVMSAGNIKI
jgi:general secretion pathway protein F